VDEVKLKRTPGGPKRFGGLVFKGAAELIWPSACINCGQGIYDGDSCLCRGCWEQVLECTGSDYCRCCGKSAGSYAMAEGVCPDCRGGGFNFDGIARAGIYAGIMQRMIPAFKRQRTELDKFFGLLVNETLKGSGFPEGIDYFVAVPLHWRRRLVRGYNQSLILARRLEHSTAKVNTDLVRIRHTKQQPMMASASARARNVAGAFAVRRGHKFKGSVVCLVDDVKTTGATLNECARVLKAAGAAKVFGLVLAVAGQNIS